jgi:hypothetical protein
VQIVQAGGESVEWSPRHCSFASEDVRFCKNKCRDTDRVDVKGARTHADSEGSGAAEQRTPLNDVMAMYGAACIETSSTTILEQL